MRDQGRNAGAATEESADGTRGTDKIGTARSGGAELSRAVTSLA